MRAHGLQGPYCRDRLHAQSSRSPSIVRIQEEGPTMSIPIRSIIVSAGLVAGLSAMASAQTTTTSSETKKFEVIAVDGNQLVVALPEGTREIAVPPGFMFTVNGKQLSVQQLKP